MQSVHNSQSLPNLPCPSCPSCPSCPPSLSYENGYILFNETSSWIKKMDSPGQGNVSIFPKRISCHSEETYYAFLELIHPIFHEDEKYIVSFCAKEFMKTFEQRFRNMDDVNIQKDLVSLLSFFDSPIIKQMYATACNIYYYRLHLNNYSLPSHHQYDSSLKTKTEENPNTESMHIVLTSDALLQRPNALHNRYTQRRFAYSPIS